MKATVNFLVKFGNEENITNLFEKGEIFMNTIKTFKEFDKQGIGDKYEGVVNIHNSSSSTLTLKFPNNPLTLNPTKLQFWESYTGHVGNIYSTYAISNLLVRRKDIHRIDKRMQIFGSHCIIIKDVVGFIEAISNELDRQKIEYSHNLVNYRDFNKLNHKITLYDKSHLLSYQKEHRIIAMTKYDKPLKFEIGSLKSFAEMYTSKEFIEKSVVERITPPNSQ